MLLFGVLQKSNTTQGLPGCGKNETRTREFIFLVCEAFRCDLFFESKFTDEKEENR